MAAPDPDWTHHETRHIEGRYARWPARRCRARPEDRSHCGWHRTNLRAALDDWAFMAPQLTALYEELNAGRARSLFDFDPRRSMAPLPRAYQLVVGEAYDTRSDDESRMVQCASDDLLGLMDNLSSPLKSGYRFRCRHGDSDQ